MADSVSSWDDYVKQHPEAKPFRNKGWNHFNKIMLLMPSAPGPQLVPTFSIRPLLLPQLPPLTVLTVHSLLSQTLPLTLYQTLLTMRIQTVMR
jgi:hypothetical protein